jgi:hypothetical protein
MPEWQNKVHNLTQFFLKDATVRTDLFQSVPTSVHNININENYGLKSEKV